MRIGLVGGTSQERSLPFQAQRTINLYPVIDQQGKEPAALYATPGLINFGMASSGRTRGMFSSDNGRAFTVSGAGVYEIESNGTTTLRGTVANTTGNVSLAENRTQLAVCDGQNLYILTYSNNNFAKVTDPDFPGAGTVESLDSYFIVNEPDTDRFYLSDLTDGSSWNALQFASAESAPDKLKRIKRSFGQLWLLGERTGEIWTNTGDRTFTFEKYSGGDLEVGILAPHSAVSISNSLIWVGRDEKGDGAVYITEGFTPQIISTSPIERLIQNATNKEDMRAYIYQQDGYTFYCLTGGGLETTLCYELKTRQWHERAYLNAQGGFSQHLAKEVIYAFGKHLAGDRRNGNIYELSLDAYDDAGDPKKWQRIYTHVSNENQRIKYNRLDIGVETGVGLQNGQGSDPKCTLFVSKDGGRTYSNGIVKSMGAAGKYQTNVTFRNFGVAEQLTFKLEGTDPVKTALCGSYLS
jgi:hypothetical protein